MATVEERLNNASNMAQSALPIVDDIMPMSPANELEQLKSQYEGNPFSYSMDPRRNPLEQQIAEQDRLQREQQYTAQRDQHKSRSELGRQGMEQITSLVGAGEMDEAYKLFEQLPIENQMMMAVAPGIGQAISAYEAQHFAPEALKSMQEGRYLSASGSGLIAGLGALDVGLSATGLGAIPARAIKGASVPLRVAREGIMSAADPALMQRLHRFFGTGKGLPSIARQADIPASLKGRIEPNTIHYNTNTGTRTTIPDASGNFPGYRHINNKADIYDSPVFGSKDLKYDNPVFDFNSPANITYKQQTGRDIMGYNPASGAYNHTTKHFDAPLRNPDGSKQSILDYLPERIGTHNDMEALIMGKTAKPVAKGQKPLAIVMAGGPGTGKGTVKQAFINRGAFNPDEFVDLDPDIIKKNIPEYKMLQEVGDSRAAHNVHAEGNEITEKIFKNITAEGNKHNIILDKTISDLEDLKYLQALKDTGYEVAVIGVYEPVEESLIRVMERGLKTNKAGIKTGRTVPGSVAKNKGLDVSAQFAQISEIADHFVLVDNLEQPVKVFASGPDGAQVFDADILKEVDLQGSIASQKENITTFKELEEALINANK